MATVIVKSGVRQWTLTPDEVELLRDALRTQAGYSDTREAAEALLARLA